MTIRKFELNLSVTDVFFLEANRTAFVGTLDRSIDDIAFGNLLPCNATLVINNKNIENFPIYLEPFACNSNHPEIKSFVTFKLNTQKEVIEQAIVDNECVIRMSISFEYE